jgi:hypothetical protein
MLILFMTCNDFSCNISYFACQRKRIYLIRILFRFPVLLMLLYWQPDISSMQSLTTTNSSSSASSQLIIGEPSLQGHSAQTAASSTPSRGSRTQTKWPEDKLTATGLDTNFWPTQMLRGIDLYWYVDSLLGRGCQSTRRLMISWGPCVVRGPVDGRFLVSWVIDNVVWTDSWLSIAGAGCGLTRVGAGEEQARKVIAGEASRCGEDK